MQKSWKDDKVYIICLNIDIGCTSLKVHIK